MNHRRTGIAVGLLLLVGLGVLLYYTMRRPPQMGADEAVFNEVDALYTAVTARNEKLLGDCEGRLNTLKKAGKLPQEAASYLDGIIATARQGRWQPAAERLYAFMSAQRRDGADRQK